MTLKRIELLHEYLVDAGIPISGVSEHPDGPVVHFQRSATNAQRRRTPELVRRFVPKPPSEAFEDVVANSAQHLQRLMLERFHPRLTPAEIDDLV